MSKIYYTKTDEAPFLATHSFLPIVKSFTKPAQIEIEMKDISLAARVLALFSDYLEPAQRVPNALNELGALTQDPNANIIKLPNISASVPQLKSAILELQGKGFKLPDFPENPVSDGDKEVRKKYAKALGSAVNPVLREGNSDRRVAAPVKQYAKNNPHRMGEWSKDSTSKVAHMEKGDFFGSEKSFISPDENTFKIEHTSSTGETTVLKEAMPLLKGEIIDSSLLSCKELTAYFEKEMQECKANGNLLSLHLKATMMKVSDPIIFGHAVKIFFKDTFEKHGDLLKKVNANPNNGLGSIYKKIQDLPADEKATVEASLKACYEKRPALAMVNSDKGITNLHVPSDVIIDASIPAALKSSGKMWGTDGELHDTTALIPDRSYARMYQTVFEFCRTHGAFDPKTMGNVSNVGLMAKKAEEYGSHDKTFEIKNDGVIKVSDKDGNVMMEHTVKTGDIWRMCQTKDVAVKDWVKLAVTRAKQTGSPAVFWLDNERAHDANLITKVEAYLKDHDTTGLTVKVLPLVEATSYTLDRVKKGEDTISVTGNVLRDYLTDLFPILELGTSAKMLSIVPLLKGGGLYETGAGGSAPKHVQQFLEENHLRWDSLGEFLALQVSIEDLGEKGNNKKAVVIAKALNEANTKYLTTDKSPSRKVGELDNRGSHFYLALYWAQALAEQNEDGELKATFSKVASELEEAESQIIDELNSAQGKALNIDGYYFADEKLVSEFMRPSATFNTILNAL